MDSTGDSEDYTLSLTKCRHDVKGRIHFLHRQLMEQMNKNMLIGLKAFTAQPFRIGHKYAVVASPPTTLTVIAGLHFVADCERVDEQLRSPNLLNNIVAAKVNQSFELWLLPININLFLVLPPQCPYFFGPFSLACLEYLWQDGGCVENGRGAPRLISEKEITNLEAMNFAYVLSFVDN